MIGVSVLLPTKGRPLQAAKVVGQLLQQRQLIGVWLTVTASVPVDDVETREALRPLHNSRFAVLPRKPGASAVVGWNQAFSYAANEGIRAQWFVLGADDVVFRDGWLTEALRVANETKAQVIGLNDGHTNLDDYAPHYMASRYFCYKELGGNIAPPAYRSWWFDREVCERAKALGVYAPAWDAVVEHRHPDWGTAPMDATYQEAWPLHDVDQRLYLERRKSYAG